MRTVDDLTNAELMELRENYFQQLVDEGEDINSARDIPMDVVKYHYQEIIFTDDDFFCNI